MLHPPGASTGPAGAFADHLGVGSLQVRACTTSRSLGDFSIDQPEDALDARRRRVVDLPWVWLRQVHRGRVAIVGSKTKGAVAGKEADAVVTAEPGLALAIQTADCAPVVLSSREGVIGAVHAGWRSIEAGILQSSLAAMRELGASKVFVWIGPRIGPECYEFGPNDLARLEERLHAVRRPGDEISLRGETSQGSLALDLLHAVQLGLGLEESGRGSEWMAAGGCTSCDRDLYFSHRARGEQQRMATVIWRG